MRITIDLEGEAAIPKEARKFTVIVIGAERARPSVFRCERKAGNSWRYSLRRDRGVWQYARPLAPGNVHPWDWRVILQELLWKVF